MSTLKTPVGPQPSGVYWRRRLVVGLGILAVLIIIILIVARPGGGKPGAAPTTAPSKSATAPTSGSGSATSSPCSPSSISVDAITDATSYATGVNPQLSLKLTNNGPAACSFNVGTDVQIYTITSGAETIWSSKDCQTAAVAATKVLEPGKPLTSTPLAWNRTRSSTKTCASTTLPQVKAGGASYHLTVSVNGVKSAKSVQFLLN